MLMHFIFIFTITLLFSKDIQQPVLSNKIYSKRQLCQQKNPPYTFIQVFTREFYGSLSLCPDSINNGAISETYHHKSVQC